MFDPQSTRATEAGTGAQAGPRQAARHASAPQALPPHFAVLIVPGLRDHMDDHWQTHLQAMLPNARTVPPLTRDRLSLAARVAALDAMLAEISAPVLLAAHSAGVQMVAHWARSGSPNVHKVCGALLATPADLESPMPSPYPDLGTLAAHGWLPVPRRPLPFLAVLAASRNDPLASFARVAAMARDWHCQLHDLGHVGHLSPASGFGPWPQAVTLLAELAQPD